MKQVQGLAGEAIHPEDEEARTGGYQRNAQTPSKWVDGEDTRDYERETDQAQFERRPSVPAKEFVQGLKLLHTDGVQFSRDFPLSLLVDERSKPVRSMRAAQH